ncbi:MAG: DUF2252 domain-containing protein [Bryobacteraceae bacterium]|nr:DUF2252 domain-containing protein [Bryobacteraceae bacterium]
MIIERVDESSRDRTRHFSEYARQRAQGAVLLDPAALHDEDRRLYVRHTLREDHQARIHNRPEGAQAKFDKLAESPFAFFRGTALLYYRDYAGSDAELPEVFSVGDVHPENFGVTANEDGAAYFGVSDFDEAGFAPFSWDVKRGATGFNLAAREKGLKKNARKAVVKSFVDGYMGALLEFARNDRERWHEFRIDNSPPLIRKLIESVQSSRRAFLAGMIDLKKGRFVATEEIVPHSKHRADFQKAIDRYRRKIQVSQEARGGHFRVKDVAIKTGSGTASLGLDRFFVLIDGESEDPADDIILEMKQARRSAMSGLTPNASGTGEARNGKRRTRRMNDAARVVQAHRMQIAGGNQYLGEVEMNGQSFLVSERSPYKGKMDLKGLTQAEFLEYARICGSVLAQVHARSDEDTGAMTGQAENRILSAVRPEVFRSDIARFAEVAADRVTRDYRLFRKDHGLRAFEFVKAMEQPG